VEKDGYPEDLANAHSWACRHSSDSGSGLLSC
jgi:hypothetical protein